MMLKMLFIGYEVPRGGKVVLSLILVYVPNLDYCSRLLRILGS
jgi:hypothetical protein